MDKLKLEIDLNKSSGYQVEIKASPRANPNRGYHDTLKTVTFWGWSAEFIKTFLEKDNAEHKADRMNMWCGTYQKMPSASPQVEIYQLNYGYDSGD
jgi:hypothetical protein